LRRYTLADSYGNRKVATGPLVTRIEEGLAMEIRVGSAVSYKTKVGTDGL